MNDAVFHSVILDLLQVIIHALNTKNLGEKLEPSESAIKSWDIVPFSDSDYVMEPISRRSVSGLILYIWVNWFIVNQKHS